jgi:cholesterol transport system auxiliary component
MSKRNNRLACVCVLLLLSACATDPLPDYRYYRPALLPTNAVPVGAQALKVAPLDVLEVEGFRADGVFGERPIVYSLAGEPQKLSQYHYQLWTDPPGAILQRRFIDVLGAMNVAASVTGRASPRAEPAKLTGFIERLERVRLEGGRFEVALKLRITVQPHRASAPLLEKIYLQTVAAKDDSIAQTVQSFGQAMDAVAVEVASDLANSAAATAR